MNHSGSVQQCPSWTQGLQDSRVHLWSEFSSMWATSCGIDLHDVVIGGGQHQDLLHVAVVEHLSRAKWVQARHGYPLLLMVAAAHRVHAAPAADACCVHLVIQQGQTVVLHAAVWGHWAEVPVSNFSFSCWWNVSDPPLPTSPVVLTRVWLVNDPCSVRQVLQNIDPGVGEVPSKQRHHLNLHILTTPSCHWHGHQPWTLPTHCPVTVAVSHWGDTWKQGVLSRRASAKDHDDRKDANAAKDPESSATYCSLPGPVWQFPHT